MISIASELKGTTNPVLILFRCGGTTNSALSRSYSTHDDSLNSDNLQPVKSKSFTSGPNGYLSD